MFSRMTRAMDLRRNKPRPYGVGVESLGYAENSPEEINMFPVSGGVQAAPQGPRSQVITRPRGFGEDMSSNIQPWSSPTQTPSSNVPSISGMSSNIGASISPPSQTPAQGASIDWNSLIGGITGGLMSTVGMISQGELLRRQADRGTPMVVTPASGGMMSMALPLLLLAVVGGGAYLYFRRKKS